MKSIVLITLLFSSLFSKECYMENNEKVCFERYYALENLQDPVKNKKHYISPKGFVYTLSGELKITLRYVGAIMYILDNYDVEYVDTLNQNTHILKVINPNELFSIITNLNKLDSISKSHPVLNRVYRKGYKKPGTNAAKKIKREKRSSKSKSSEKGKYFGD